jgi:mRNA-degrading endonuclease toxin of MazEF toxin-antitoxin module
VNVSQIYTVDKSALIEKIGTLPQERIGEISAGLKLLLEPRQV